jgi:16S rRNA (cytosine1402-N4)-methyltransferase
VNGIVIDLGASSMQFDTPERGFSFLHDGPLDMRFDPRSPLTAADIINTWDERSIADVIFKYGEERRSRQVAKAILAVRPLETTRQLAELVAGVVGQQPGVKTHPATRTFQALRIAVNDELGAIETTLPQAVEVLAPGGRLAVITFHSLEDRIVKNIFRDLSRDLRDETHPMAPVIRPAVTRLVQRKPIIPADEEIVKNPRARSAKLRVVEKLN